MRLTKDQAAIIGVYTGVTCGPFSDVHKKIEQLLGRPVFTHEMASEALMTEVRKKVTQEFMDLCYVEEVGHAML